LHALHTPLESGGDVVTIGSHQFGKSMSTNYITPRWLLDRLALFACDPCAASPRPWDCGEGFNFTLADNGLEREWYGLVFCNPPFDSAGIAAWIDRLARHEPGGILLTHARCETAWFQLIWKSATGLLFLDRRIKFCKPDGSTHSHNSGAPVVLAAFGDEAMRRLQNSGLGGALIIQWRVQPPASAFYTSASGQRFLLPTGEQRPVSHGQARS
jgi:hypothetical protein